MKKIDMLKKMAEEFLKKEYGLELTVPILPNKRLKSVLGRFTIRGKKPYAIELSAELLKYQSEEVVIDVLKHELIHYACYVQGKPWKDRDKDFKNELKKHGVCKTGTYAYKGKVHIYQCVSCKAVVNRRRRMNVNEHNLTTRYVCGKCQAPLKYQGENIR